jgi:hypothetical protein
MRSRAIAWLLIPVAGLAVAACSSAKNTHTSAPSTSNAPSTAAASGDASAQIKANWQEFFDAKTPADRRVQLLENGQQFADIIRAQSGSGLAASATSQVTNVSVQSPTRAVVTYSILVGGTPQLTNQTGDAVFQDGVWKVGLGSFCALLGLENGGNTSGLPAACPSG